jgi:hypothetical protein
MAEATDVIKAVNELINAQADQLWTISISIIVAEVFMIAHLTSLRSMRLNHRIVVFVIGVSAFCHALSLAFGYLSKGALIKAMILLAQGKDWHFPELAETFNFLQVTFVTFGLFIFVICFFFYSRELAKAITAGKS